MKTITLFACLLISQLATSQNFISENKLWHVRDFSWDIIITQIYKIEGDTNINSKVYKKLWSTGDSAMNDFWAEGFIREESGVVYYLRNYNENEGVLYDFSLEEGDTAYITNEFCDEVQIIVSETDTVEYFGIPRKRWILEGWTGDYWIEGIGSNYGLFYTKMYECVADIYKELLCFHENDTLFYILPGEDECFQTSIGIGEEADENNLIIKPNPVVSGQSFIIQSDKEIKEVEIYNSAAILEYHSSLNQTSILKIPTVNLKAGLYFIRIKAKDNNYIIKKIIIR